MKIRNKYYINASVREADGPTLISLATDDASGELEQLRAEVRTLREVLGRLLDRVVPEGERLEVCGLEYTYERVAE